MQQITILGVGRIKERFMREAIAEYEKRLSRYCRLEIQEVKDTAEPENASDADRVAVCREEGERLLSRLRPDDHVIALAIDGKRFDSRGFAEHIDRLNLTTGGRIVFVIGGSLGLSDAVMQASHEAISFSEMTFPHQLMRLILLEQIYRAHRIIRNEPYHK